MLNKSYKHNGMLITEDIENAEYVKDIVLGANAVKKEAITKKYPESLQLNLMRKAILGDTQALATLQAMDTDLNAL